MSNSIVTEQATRLVLQIVEDYERLAQELLELNLEEALDGNPVLYGPLALSALNGIKTDTQRTYTFIQSMRLAIKEKDEGV